MLYITSKAPNSEYTDSGDVSTESEPWGGVAEETEGMSPGGSKLSTHRSHTHWAKYVHIGGQGGAKYGHMGGTFPVPLSGPPVCTYVVM